VAEAALISSQSSTLGMPRLIAGIPFRGKLGSRSTSITLTLSRFGVNPTCAAVTPVSADEPHSMFVRRHKCKGSFMKIGMSEMC
jgi:hypothetical protein